MLALARALGSVRTVAILFMLVLAAGWLLLAVAFGVVPVGPGLTTRVGGVAPGDFMFFYPAGVLASEGRAAEMYDMPTLTATSRDRFGPKVPDLSWPYPPTMALPMALLGRMSPGLGLVMWVAVMSTAILIAGRLSGGSWRLAPLAFLFPASGLALFTSQVTPALTLFAAIGFLGHRRGRTSGLAVGLLTLKPQFAFGPAAYLASRRDWRGLGVAGAAVAALVVLSVVAFGVDVWVRFVENGFRHAAALSAEAPLPRFVTPFAAAATAGVPLGWAIAVHGVAMLVLLPACWWMWQHGTRESTRMLGLMAATVQFTPQALDYDLVFLLLPWMVMIRECLDDPAFAPSHFLPWVLLTALVPVSYLVSLYTHQSVTAPILFLLVGVAWRREGLGKRRDDDGGKKQYGGREFRGIRERPLHER